MFIQFAHLTSNFLNLFPKGILVSFSVKIPKAISVLLC